MKKTFYLLALLSVFFSCEKDYNGFEDNNSHENTNSVNQKGPETDSNLDTISIDKSVATRSGIVEFYRKSVYLEKGKWKGNHFTKDILKIYKVYLNITPSNGKAYAYAYGYNSESEKYKYKSKSTNSGANKVSISNRDLLSNEDFGTLWGRGTQTGYVDFVFSYERIDKSNQSSNLKISPYDASPNEGIVRETNFNFKVKCSNYSEKVTGKIEFIDPDGNRKSYRMYKNGSYLKFDKKFSQNGEYKYRYIVTDENTTKKSNWKYLQLKEKELKVVFNKPNPGGYKYGTLYGTVEGVEVRSNGPDYIYSGGQEYVNGQYVGLKYQCVNLIRKYFYVKFGKIMGGNSHAKDFFKKAYKWDFTSYENGKDIPPMPGDVLCIGSTPKNDYGHVAIISKVTNNYIEVCQQNVGNLKHLSYRYYRDGNTILGTSIQGWIRMQ